LFLRKLRKLDVLIPAQSATVSDAQLPQSVVDQYHRCRSASGLVPADCYIKRAIAIENANHADVELHDNSITSVMVNSTWSWLNGESAVWEDCQRQQYHVVRHSFVRPEEFSTHLGTVVVMLAFLLPEAGAKLSSQPLFAFLPIMDAGFRFTIHADFELVASRQQLKNDSRWNVFLRKCITETFLFG
jgi:hypothetical protein